MLIGQGTVAYDTQEGATALEDSALWSDFQKRVSLSEAAHRHRTMCSFVFSPFFLKMTRLESLLLGLYRYFPYPVLDITSLPSVVCSVPQAQET
jgi:hypothetical protein